MVAPTRRAAPVISTALPCSGKSRVARTGRCTPARRGQLRSFTAAPERRSLRARRFVLRAPRLRWDSLRECFALLRARVRLPAMGADYERIRLALNAACDVDRRRGALARGLALHPRAHRSCRRMAAVR